MRFVNRSKTQKEFLRLYKLLPDDNPRKIDALEKYAKFCNYYEQAPSSDAENVILITYEESEELQKEKIRRQQALSQKAVENL